MSRLKEKGYFVYLIILILTLPTFAGMLRPGIFSMQDPHLFRLFEFSRCVDDWQLPCRWAPDATFGYGQPLFNFYAQASYFLGAIFHLLGFQLIDSLKLLFILSIAGSAVSMFFLAKQMWKNSLAALLASVIYVYAPYRALDVWVRGALPEAVSFALFPIIMLYFNKFIEDKKQRDLLLLSFFSALLVITHNLSAFMFGFFLSIWGGFVVVTRGNFRLIFPLIGAFIFSLLISAFYILPLLLESQFVHFASTTTGYFDFRAHFTTLYQLLISRFWGYGASVFGTDDGLSLAVGQVQWVVPLIALSGLVLKKDQRWRTVGILVFMGWLSLFLTHNKSTFIWENLSFFSFLQFPWRWLSIATFSFSLAAGGVVFLLTRFRYLIGVTSIVVAIALTLPFFKEDIWFETTDKQELTGSRFEEYTAMSRSDYWPIFAKEVPNSLAPEISSVTEGEGGGEFINKTSNEAQYGFNIVSQNAQVQVPIVFFPGWKAHIDDEEIDIYPSGIYGLITANVSGGIHILTLSFTNTPIRTIGNIVSLLSLLTVVILLLKVKDKRYG